MLLFLSGLFLVLVGLLAELLVRVYHESQGKPIYVVRELRPGESPRPAQPVLATEPAADPAPAAVPLGGRPAARGR